MDRDLLEKLIALKNAETECDGADLDWFFEPPLYPKAKKLCAVCPERVPCLEYAMEANEQYGIWGGTSPEMRRKLRTQQRREK